MHCIQGVGGEGMTQNNVWDSQVGNREYERRGPIRSFDKIP